MANTYELISSNTLGSNTASVSFSSIPTTFNDLVLRISTRDATNGAVQGNALMTINGSTTTASYETSRLLLTGPSTVSATRDNGIAGFNLISIGTGSTAPTNSFGFCEIYITNYNATSRLYLSISTFSVTNNTMISPSIMNGRWNGAAAVSSITVASNGGTFATGSSFNLYGIKNT